MRKATLLIAVLLSFGLVAAFAGPVEVEPEYEAEASATWGAQLDEFATGFSNSAESTIKFTFIEEQTAEYGEGDVYGYIEVDSFKVEFEAAGVDNGTGSTAATSQSANDAFDIALGEITAKVFLGPAYIVVYDGADDAVDEAFGAVEVAGDIISGTQTVGLNPDVKNDPTTEYGGTAVGFEVPDLVTVELGVASEFDWSQSTTATTTYTVVDTNDSLSATEEADLKALIAAGLTPSAAAASLGITLDADDVTTTTGPADKANEENAYVWSINAEVTPVPGVTVALVSNMWHGNGTGDATPGTAGNPAAVGLSGSYDLALSDDMTLTPELGFDLKTEQDAEEDQEMQFEVGVGANLLWPGLGVEDSDEDYLAFEDSEVTSGVGLEVVYGSHPVDLILAAADGTVDENVNTVATKLGFYEDGGDDGFLPIVGAALVMNYNMVLANDELAQPYEDGWSDFGVGLEADASLGVVTPFFGVISESFNVGGNDSKYGGDTATTMFLNLGTDIDVIPNTTFTIDYSSGDLLYDSVDGKGQAADPTFGYVYGTTFEQNGGFSNAQTGELSIETTVSF